MACVAPSEVVDFIRDHGRGLDEIEIGFLFESLLDDFHVQQAQEAAAKAKAECLAGFGFEFEAGVVDGESFQGVAEFFKVLPVGRVKPAEDHPLGLLIAWQWLDLGVDVGDRVADVDVFDGLDIADQVTDLSGGELGRTVVVRGRTGRVR